MGLTCSCDYDPEPGMKVWFDPKDYSTLATRRSRKCCSCGERINVGDTCAEVPRAKIPETEVECRIYGEDGEVPMASAYMCERCAGLAFSLDELGYCGQPWEDQRELVKEYAEMHQKAPNGEVRGASLTAQPACEASSREAATSTVVLAGTTGRKEA